MKTILTALVLASVIPLSVADESRRARVERALGETGCGRCRGDLDACRAESLRTGKPLVLFVGGCDGRVSELTDDAAIPCRIAEYAGDDRPDAEKRIVILGPKPGGAKLMIWRTLPGGASAADLQAAVKAAAKEAPAMLDWSFGGK